MSLDPGQDLDSELIAANLSQPTWASGKKGPQKEQQESGDELDAPSSSETGSRVRCADERAAVTNEVHDENTEFDGKLLNNNDRATGVLLGNFGEVYGHLRAGDADTNAVDDTACNQLADGVGRDLNRSTAEPPETGKHDRVAAAKFIRNWPCEDCTDDRTCGEGRTNGT